LVSIFMFFCRISRIYRNIVLFFPVSHVTIIEKKEMF
jgi:hypothetical protein